MDPVQEHHHSGSLPDWQHIINAIPLPIFLHDHNHHILQANRAYGKLAGLPLEEILGRHYWQIFPKLEGPLPGCQAALAGHGEREEDVVLSSGKIFRSWAFALENEEGQYLYSVHLLEEVTEVRILAAQHQQLQEELRQRAQQLEKRLAAQQRSQKAMLRSEEQLRTIVEHSADGILVLDKKGSILFVNPAALALFARGAGELVGQRFGFPLVTGETSEIEVVRPDGRITSVEMGLVAIDWQGQPAHVVSLHDISERRHLESERQEHLCQTQKTLVETIQAMARTVETRDPYTAGHQQRSSNLAVAIGWKMGLAADCIEGIRLGGIIHDIGKLYIPAEILSRPGTLTDLEFSMIKTHPQVGFEIMKDINFIWPISDIVLQHHERLDGSGYPQGLQGKAIRLEARLLMVADVVEAMASHRPYRPALSLDTALAHIAERRGTWFEPAAVDACVSLFKDQGYVFTP